ncbi:Arc family DNA-binding protein [Leptospira interrogans]
MARKPNEAVQLKLRFTEGLRRQLEREANRHDVSMNSEIIRRLEESFKADQSEEALRKLIFDHEEVLRKEFDFALSQKGFQRIQLDQGVVWAEPGMKPEKLSVSIDAATVVQAMTAELVGVLARALQKAADKDDGEKGKQ